MMLLQAPIEWCLRHSSMILVEEALVILYHSISSMTQSLSSE